MQFLLALLLVVVSAASASAQAPRTLTVTIDGAVRRALVFDPKSPSGAVPLVFVFHGAGDTADGFSEVGIHTEWPEAVVVYMDGFRDAGDRGGYFDGTTRNSRDLKFFDAALAGLKMNYPLDPGRVYATGYSNGAHFVYLLWATRPQVFAAFAPVAGAIRHRLPLSVPKPLLHVGSAEDQQVQYTEQLATIERARQANGATAEGGSCGPGCLIYPSLKAAPVLRLTHPLGHTYPAPAPAAIVRFFKSIPQ